ncbi:MAG: NAD(P)-dependent oxidoreductase [Proteobacteria bacterium]|nr:NAD(P)-dependent oxidoreductase [Pseudomonadota bacterium]HQR02722.1 NAD(P)-dependent oxidoreductase [Rhodocyclaceae bacterium]
MAIHVGFIGLGNIGRPMARHLCGPEFDLVVHDVNPEASREFPSLGGKVAISVAALAAHAGLIGICVRDDADLMALAEGPDGLIARGQPGTVIAIHSTIHRHTLLEVARQAATRDITVIDAPITGGAQGAAQRNLCTMVGGEAAALERVHPMLAAYSGKIIHAGPLGTGMTLKLCNNLITYLQLIAAHEGFRLAASAGLAPELLREVTQANGNLTPTMAAFLGNRGAAPPGAFDAFATLAEKDLDCALQLAADVGVDLRAGLLARAEIGNTYRNLP